jgi:hypothetical protein
MTAFREDILTGRVALVTGGGTWCGSRHDDIDGDSHAIFDSHILLRNRHYRF